jgi:hypothetical protein
MGMSQLYPINEFRREEMRRIELNDSLEVKMKEEDALPLELVGH